MKKNSWNKIAVIFTCLLILTGQRSLAKDDFGRIVHHIEAQYHVHRQHRFAMGLAGFIFKIHHFAGVKSLKGAIFENQQFLNAGADGKLDEIIRGAAASGWQPLVRSWDRNSGERTYVYAQDSGRDMTVLVVTLESNDAVVLQVKVDPQRLNDVVQEASAGRHRREPAMRQEDSKSATDAEQPVGLPQNWDGICLISEAEYPGVETH